MVNTNMNFPDNKPSMIFGQRISGEFPMFNGNHSADKLIYLDNAATTQKPQCVLDSVVNYYINSNANIGRSVHSLSMQASNLYESAREKVCSFIHAKDAKEIVFTKHTTESINMVAEALGKSIVQRGDKVVITGMEHHSNLLPWKRLCEKVDATLGVVPVGNNGRISMDRLMEELESRTKVLAIAHVSNVLGTINPIKEIISEARKRKIIVVVDGAQAIAHQVVDVQELDADFYCFSSHKMYGPMGIGVLYGKFELLEQMEPFLTGGGIVKNVAFFGDSVRYVPPPHRLESGTPDVASAVGLAAAIDFLGRLGMDHIAEYEAVLSGKTIDLLQSVDGVRVLGSREGNLSSMVSFIIEGLHPYDIGNHLNTHGIAVRTGVHCAIPFADALGIVGSVRISFGVYNHSSEIDRLIGVLRTAEKGFWSHKHANDRSISA
jgi:SufS family cysteine desulfurase